MAALTDHTHEVIAEAIIEPLDVRQHAHTGMVLTVPEAVHAVPEAFPPCMRFADARERCSMPAAV
jgi:hypothetical protein